MDQTLIDNLGLEETEAKIYLALLELGPATVTKITNKAGVTRTLGYHVLEKLGWKGLVYKSSGSRKKLRYIAEHPRELLQNLKNKQSSLNRQVAVLERTLPELTAIFKTAEKPAIKFQDGLNWVKSIYSETLNSKSEILSILDLEGWSAPELNEFGKKYNKERSKRKIYERILILDTPAGRDWMKHYQGSTKYTKYRWIKPQDLPGILNFGGEINVYEDKTVIAMLKSPNQMGIMIQSSVVANIYKAMFEMIWKTMTNKK